MARAARGGEGGVRSLNLSVAVGIVLFEAQRQLVLGVGFEPREPTR